MTSRRAAPGVVVVSDTVGEALDRGSPVVALETTLVAHGFPRPHGMRVALDCDAAVRAAGATPATVGIFDGRIRIGFGVEDLERFTPDARKVGPRDLAPCVASGAVGATTVGGTLVAGASVGIRFLGTGGIGGLHRGFPHPPDVSADLPALARIQALVVSSGVKSLLDIPATMEALETLGVPVLGYRTDSLPRFYSATGGPPVPGRAESPAEAARIADVHWRLDGRGLLLANPPPESIEVDELVEEGVAEAESRGVAGQDVTPFVLAFLHKRSGGRTLEVNHALVVANARLAAETAVAFAAL